MKAMERIARRSGKEAAAPAAVDGGHRGCVRISNKRRREEEDEGSTDENCEVKVEDNLILSQISSSSTSARRRNHPVVTVTKQGPPLKVVHEMMGVRVPRKARSGSGKRSHESSLSGNDGAEKEKEIQEQQNVQKRKKMKPIGDKNRPPPKSLKYSSGRVDEDIEIEIAEVLFRLKKQSQRSNNSDCVKISTSNLEAKDRNSTSNETKNPILEPENSHDSDPEHKNVCKEKIEEDKNASSVLQETPIAEEVVVESDQQLKEEEQVGQDASVSGIKSNKEESFKFDLMAPPPMEEDSTSDRFVEEAMLEKLQEEKTEATREKLDDNPNKDSGTKLQQPPTTSTSLQPGNSILSQPCSNRCATHLYIARNIYLHQKVAKMNKLYPAKVASTPLCDTKTEIVIRSPIPGSFPADRGQESKDKSSEIAERKKFIDQQPILQPGSNIMHGHTFKFPVGQNQASQTSDPSDPLRYAKLTNSTLQFSHSPSPTVAAVNLNTPYLTSQQGRSLVISQYSFPISTPTGTTMAFQGENSPQTIPLYSGHFYSNQMFHSSQLHQQQRHSPLQHQFQPTQQKNTDVSTDSSSSSHKQQESQQLQKTQFSSNNFLASTSTQKQHVPQSLQPSKLEKENYGGIPTSSAYNPSSHAQNSVYSYGQNLAVPLQPMNFTLMPYATMSGGGSGNHIEQSQQDLKGVFGMSFASFTGNKETGSLLSFSSMSQNPAVYQTHPATQAQQKNQVCERRAGCGSNNSDHDGSKVASGKSSSTGVQTLVFDKSATNLNFKSSNSQQQHMFQFQLQQPQLLHYQQPVMAARNKAPKNVPAYSQPLLRCNTSFQSPQMKNSGRSLTSQVPITTSTVSSFLQQQGRASKGQTQISFGGNSKSSLAVAPQGPQILTNPSLLTT